MPRTGRQRRRCPSEKSILTMSMLHWRRHMAESNAQTTCAAAGSVKEMRLQEALRDALRYEMARDERVFVMGEDVALFGGAYGVTRGLLQEFGERRVLDT